MMDKQVFEELQNIKDPDTGSSIIEMGSVQDLRVDGHTVSLTLETPVHISPSIPPLLDTIKTTLKRIDGITDVDVTLRGRQPRRMAPGGMTGLGQVKSVIAVSSCKGGVGKSTVAASLAMELAGRGHKVGLLDTDVFGPSVPTLFNMHQEGVYGDKDSYVLPVERHGIKVLSFGFLLGRKPAVLRGPIVTNYVQQFLHKAAWGELDVLLLDMPPGTGDIQLTISQSVQLDGALIITTPQALALADVEKGIIMFDKVNVPVLGIIENMAWFECDGCGKRHTPFGSGIEALSERFGLDTLARLPIDPEQYGRQFNEPVSNPAFSEATDAILQALRRNSSGSLSTPSASFDDNSITLDWADGRSLKVTNRDLRLACACALCINEMTGEAMLDPATIPDDIKPKEIRPIGNYAIMVEWSDGHDSGLFPYRVIEELGDSA
jgi:ATP-binding protein involved in chromosome partitioning